MKLYIVVYDYPNWKIETVDSNEIRRMGGRNVTTSWKEHYARYKENVGFYGPIYYRDQIYTTREAAQMYIDRYELEAKAFQWSGC